jgi:type IV secretory pathway VirB4 component
MIKDSSPIFDSIRILDTYKDEDGDDVILNSDGSIGLMLSLDGTNDAGFGSEDYDPIYEAITSMLKQVQSSEITINFHSIRNCAFDAIPEQDESLPELITERVEFLKLLAKKSEIFENRYFISINSLPLKSELSLSEKIKVATSNLKQLLGASASNDIMDLKLQTAQRRCREIKSVRNTLVSTLSAKGISCQKLNADQIWKCFQDYYRPFSTKSGYIKRDESHVLRKDLFRGMECTEDQHHFISDNYLHQTFELEYLSHQKSMYEGSINSILNTPFENVFTICFRSMTKDESKVTIQKEKRETRRTMNSSINNRGEIEDLESSYDLQRVEGAEDRLAETNSTLVQMACSFTYRKKMDELSHILKSSRMDIEEFVLDNTIKLKNNVFNKVADSEWVSPRGGQWEAFCCYTPGVANLMNNTFESLYELPENLPFLLPIFKQARPDIEHMGNNHFFTQELGIENFQLIDPSQNSWSYLISGDMGKGKSVVMNILMAMSLNSLKTSGKKPIIRLIDYGGITSSFFKFINIIDGEIADFSKRKLPKINPLQLAVNLSLPKTKKLNQLVELFKDELKNEENPQRSLKGCYEDIISIEGRAITNEDLIQIFKKIGIDYMENSDVLTLKEGECLPDTKKTNIIMSCISIMLVDDPTDINSGSSLYDYDSLLSLITATYEDIDGRSPLLSDLKASALKLAEFQGGNEYLTSLVLKLEKWTGNGAYSMFDAPTEIDFDNDVIMFDLFGIKNDPFLSGLYNILLLDLITVDMFNKIDRDRVFLIDEAHQCLETKAFRDVIKPMMRLSRKYKFALLLASQLPSDWFESDEQTGRVIVSQATNFIFCGTGDSGERQRAKQIYDLTDGQTREIGKLGVKTRGGTRNAPRFSTFMMIKVQKDIRRTSIYRNILSPYEYNAYSSSAEDNAIFRYFMNNEGMSPKEVTRLITDGKHIKNERLMEYLRKTNNLSALKQVS